MLSRKWDIWLGVGVDVVVCLVGGVGGADWWVGWGGIGCRSMIEVVLVHFLMYMGLYKSQASFI